MLSLYEILKASKTGIAPDMWTALAGANFGGAGSGAETKEITGIPPLSIRSNGTMLLDYLISGNMTQSGTPTQDSPIQPQETGERTGNLWDEEYPNISETIRYIPLYVGNGSFTLSTTTPYDSSVANLFLLSGNVSTGASTPGNGVWLNHNVTAQSVDGYVTIAYRHYTNTTSPTECKTMLNTGSTALPYEPYGYKLTISSANTTTPIYLGEVQTTRKIRKMRLVNPGSRITVPKGYTRLAFNISEHVAPVYFKGGGYCNMTSWRANYNAIGFVAQEHTMFITQDIPEWETLEGATEWLNSNEVYIWYVLAEPTTGIVNEPIRKIGDYADTISMEQAGVQIPTLHGNTVIDVLTDVKPSEVYIKYQE